MMRPSCKILYFVGILVFIFCVYINNAFSADNIPLQRIQRKFNAVQANYPPKKITLIGIKDQKILELWAQNQKKQWKLIYTYPILAASGNLGPKLEEGDLQVPEGIYKILWLNPKSQYHLSLKLNYPNSYDIQKAKLDHRKNPGSDIFIHGKSVSIGCLAMGDTTIEELYALIENIGIQKVLVILSPTDMRQHKPSLTNLSHIRWIKELYSNIEESMNIYQ